MKKANDAQTAYIQAEQNRFTAEFEMSKLAHVEKKLLEEEQDTLREQMISPFLFLQCIFSDKRKILSQYRKEMEIEKIRKGEMEQEARQREREERERETEENIFRYITT
jgi:hypothetical protein